MVRFKIVLITNKHSAVDPGKIVLTFFSRLEEKKEDKGDSSCSEQTSKGIKKSYPEEDSFWYKKTKISSVYVLSNTSNFGNYPNQRLMIPKVHNQSFPMKVHQCSWNS